MSNTLDRLTDLSALHNDVLELISRSATTLRWFGNQFLRTSGVPMSSSRLLDRPFLNTSSNVGPAFEILHAMLRAERALRSLDDPEAQNLHKSITALQDYIHERTTLSGGASAKAVTSDDAAAYCRPLVCDDLYGTVNCLTAAAVLRSEVYPQRSEETPSYLAGHILFAELSLSMVHAESHAATGLGARPPRLAVVSRAVHSIMLYIEHLRQRAELFSGIAESLKKVADLRARIDSLGPTSGELDADLATAEDGFLRYHVAKIRSLLRRAGSLILATRSNFREWCRLLDSAIYSKEPLTYAVLEHSFRCAFSDAAAHVEAVAVSTKQQHARHVARRYCADLFRTIDNVAIFLNETFRASNDSALFAALAKDSSGNKCVN